MDKEVVRQYCAPWTVDFSLKFEKMKKIGIDQLFIKHSPDTILKNYCDEPQLYEKLQKSYNTVLYTKENNEDFTWVYHLNKKFDMQVSEDITIYYFQNKLRIKNQKVFPWDYPYCIEQIGCRNGYGDLEIINDFLHLNFIHFFLKYNLPREPMGILKKRSDNLFHIECPLQIRIDNHITFEYVLNNLAKEKYIADVWYFENEEILHDLFYLPTIQFGLKYRAFWCP